MGTWISHLRIAENLIKAFPFLDEVSFTFGSLAPDSGLPNADWTVFDPPKSVSHFIPEGGTEKEIEDLAFYRSALLGITAQSDPSLYSFLFGYFTHLVSDRLWTERVDSAFRVAYPGLFAAFSEVEAINHIKEDMYSLDQRFVRDHPGCSFWRVFLVSPIPASPLEFVRQAAFEHQMNYIKDFYAHPSSGWVLDRPYPYINEKTMSVYVEETSSSLIKIARLLAAFEPPTALGSAVTLLTTEDTAVFKAPLGDEIP